MSKANVVQRWVQIVFLIIELHQIYIAKLLRAKTFKRLQTGCV